MRFQRFQSFCVSVFLVVAAAAAGALAQGLSRSSSSETVRHSQKWGELPFAFELNRGQIDPEVDYLSRGNGYVAFLNSSGLTLSLHQQDSAKGNAVRLRLLEADSHAASSAEQPLTGKVNYLIGSDPAQWKIGVPLCSRVRYAQVYPHIDLVYYGTSGHLEYDFLVQPGADVNKIVFQIEGAQSLRIASNGDLNMQLPDGEIAWQRPEVYQLRNGKREPVPAQYQLAANTVRFKVGEYDHALPLVIDPSLSFGTYIGTSDGSVANAIALDSSNNVYITGAVSSSAYPTTPGAYQRTFYQQADVFISKLSADGSTLLYSTYVAGSEPISQNAGNAIAVDGSGNAFVGGVTNTSNFPTTPGALHLFSPAVTNGFMLKLNSSGSALLYSAEIGNASVLGLAIDSVGDAYATGAMLGTASQITFETTPGAYKTTAGSDCDYDSYVFELNPSGSAPVYSTYIAECEEGFGIVVQNGEAYVSGVTQQYHPVTAGVVQPTYGGGYDAFVTKLNTSGSGLVYSTYLGGALEDQAYSLAVDSSGNAIVAGITFSTNYPVANAFQPTFTVRSTEQPDAFVTKLNATGTAYVYSTYLGGSYDSEAHAVAVDSSGNAYVTGDTTSIDFPLQDAFVGFCGDSNITYCESGAAFVSKFSPSGSFLSSTYYGPQASFAYANGVAVDSSGNAYIAGSAGYGLPTTPNAYEQSTTNNNNNATVFAAEINMGGTTGCTNLRQNRTVAICTPFTNATYGNMVEVSAFVNDTSPVSAVQIYIDGTLELENDTTPGLGGFAIDSYVEVPSGTHRITVKGWDSSGNFQSVRYVTVSGTSTSTCAPGEIIPYVQICSPIANSSSSNPVEVSAISDYGATAMRLYVDGKSTYTIDNSSSLTTSVTLSSGVHRLTVEAWDGKGETWKQVVYVTVQ